MQEAKGKRNYILSFHCVYVLKSRTDFSAPIKAACKISFKRGQLIRDLPVTHEFHHSLKDILYKLPTCPHEQDLPAFKCEHLESVASLVADPDRYSTGTE